MFLFIVLFITPPPKRIQDVMLFTTLITQVWCGVGMVGQVWGGVGCVGRCGAGRVEIDSGGAVWWGGSEGRCGVE